MKQKLYLWIEDYLFYPNLFQKFISFLLLPLSFIYMLIIWYKKVSSKKIDYKIPVISIGNLIIGGSGKTPICVKLASNYDKVCVVLRGYGRKSKGLFVISKYGKILQNIEVSGDEAMLLAKALPKASVIVCENRVEGILKAKELGSKVVFLDDGFSKYYIKKFDILLKPRIEPTNNFCLPSGGYREFKSHYKYADMILQEGIDFNRKVSFLRQKEEVSLPFNLVLLTAISKPKRLLEFLPEHVILEAFPDHYEFTDTDIANILEKYKNYSILTTFKDYVKLEKFKIENIILMNLDIEINNYVIYNKIDGYLKNYE